MCRWRVFANPVYLVLVSQLAVTSFSHYLSIGAYTIMTIKMVAMTRTRTDISDKFSVIFSHGMRSIAS